jgi:cell division transport system permease protein
MTDMTDTEDRFNEADERARRRAARLRGLRVRRRRLLRRAARGKDRLARLRLLAAPPVVNPIVPPHSMARRALLSLVAIMSFLASLSVGAVSLVSDRASDWQRQIAEEVTIQVQPGGEGTVEARMLRAVEIAMQTPGESDAAELLAPWLGRDFDRSELPVPRLIAVQVSGGADLGALAQRLRDEVAGASLDDHGLWLERLSAMANVVTLVGFGVVALVLAATALSVVFATRGAMAGNRDVIEVLHFVGAEDSYIAREFQRHFLALGLKGAGLGGAAAIALFLVLSIVASPQGPTPEEAQIRSLFGGLSVGAPAYLGVLATVVLTGFLIAATARVTVRRTLAEMD